jgi:hypothetical protein
MIISDVTYALWASLGPLAQSQSVALLHECVSWPLSCFAWANVYTDYKIPATVIVYLILYASQCQGTGLFNLESISGCPDFN